MKATFGRASRFAQALFFRRPTSVSVDPLDHFRTCGALRGEAAWSIPAEGVGGAAMIALVADRNGVRIHVQTDGALTPPAARDLARTLATVNEAAAELEKILKET